MKMRAQTLGADMYASSDPRSKLDAASSKSLSPTAFAPASYCRFYGKPAPEQDENGRVWYARGANFLVAYTEAFGDSRFVRANQLDEWAIINPDKTCELIVETSLGQTRIDPYSVAFVPPGESIVRAPSGGRFVRIFSTRSGDINAKCENADQYSAKQPNIPPFQAWPEPRDGFRVRVYSLEVGDDPGRFGRIFRCTTLMINILDPRVGPRDTSKLSPHHHDDFEQGSLVLDGDYIHDIRWPWTPDMALWRDDEHEQCGAPSLAVIPPLAIHTSRCIGKGFNQMVDIFSPPRMDFSKKNGWVLNAHDYPMPGDSH